MASKTSPSLTTTNIAPALLDWFALHGRHDLPWQQPRSAYRVWISEIMLQQTQVTTVIPYFERFMLRFPDITCLAEASIDEVLHLWTGLGYYARARNLHKAAQSIREQHAGQLPRDFDALLALPGIGRSTAGAILAQAYGQRFAILDGNVKRVLTRLFAVEGWPGQKRIQDTLWQYAEALTPDTALVDYTQAIMDLGATVCTRSQPACSQCPLNSMCVAHQQGAAMRYPTAKPKKLKPTKQTRMLIIQDESGQHVLLEQRPPSGIWGGLWSFPECPADDDIEAWCTEQLQLCVETTGQLPALRHSFSHYHLDITPVRLTATQSRGLMDSSRWFWYNTRQPDARGLPAPVKSLLARLGN